MGIRKRLVFLLLVFFVPLILLEVFIFYRWYEDRKEAELQANLELARAVARTFDSFVANMLDMELAVGLAATGSPPLSKDALRKIMAETEKAHPALRSFTWISPEGVHLVTTNPRIQNRKIASTSWAELSRLRSEDWAITPAYTSSYSGEIVFTISRGFRDQKGNHLGVVSCTAVASKLDSLFALPRSNHAGISLIDNKGMHVYRYPPTEYTLEQRDWLKLYPVPIGEALKGKEVFTTQASKISGTNRLVAFVPIPSVGWVASCSRAEKEVMAGIVRSLLPQTILILLVTIGALGTAVGLSRPITVSLVKLKNQAEAIGRGERERAEVEAGPGEPMELTDTLNQMTEKLRLGKEALRESEEKYKKLVKYAPAAIYEMDLQGTKFLSVNEAMCDILGYSRDELLSMKPVDLIDRQSGELFSDRIKRNLAGERLDETAEYRVRRKDGEWITAAISAGATTN